MNNSFFLNVDLDSTKFNDDINDVLNKKRLYFIVKWTQRGPIKFHKVNWKVKDGDWNAAIPTTINSTSGNIELLLGSFDAGTSITVSFRLEAFAQIPQIVAMIVQDNPGKILQRTPFSGFKNLANGDYWDETADADVLV